MTGKEFDLLISKAGIKGGCATLKLGQPEMERNSPEINLSQNRENAQAPRFRQRGCYISSRGLFRESVPSNPYIPLLKFL